MDIIKIDEHRLSYELIGNSEKENVAIFLHGIMGSKKNLHSFVTKLANLKPTWTFFIFDLPNHGESSKHWGPFDLGHVADILLEATNMLCQKTAAVIGHSFGAKVATLLAFRMKAVKSLWLLDCSPDLSIVQPLSMNSALTIIQLIEILENIKWPLKSHKELVDILLDHEVDKNIALWMSTNLVLINQAYFLKFDPKEIILMLKSFLATDVWNEIAIVSKNTKVHLVAAEWGNRLGEKEEQKLKEITNGKGYFHKIKNAGHFLHADNPEGLLEVFIKYL